MCVYAYIYINKRNKKEKERKKYISIFLTYIYIYMNSKIVFICMNLLFDKNGKKVISIFRIKYITFSCVLHYIYILNLY